MQWSCTKCGVCERDHAALIMRRLWHPRSCCAMEEKLLPCNSEGAVHVLDISGRWIHCQILNFTSYDSNVVY